MYKTSCIINLKLGRCTFQILLTVSLIKNVADITIDVNAGTSNTDIRSLLNGESKSYVSLSAETKVDKRNIKKIVVHKGQGVTQIVYTHIDLPHKLEAINLI